MMRAITSTTIRTGTVKLRKTRSPYPQGIVISGSLEHKILDIDLGCLPAT